MSIVGKDHHITLLNFLVVMQDGAKFPVHYNSSTFPEVLRIGEGKNTEIFALSFVSKV